LHCLADRYDTRCIRKHTLISVRILP
jgi:hypothetical protein